MSAWRAGVWRALTWVAGSWVSGAVVCQPGDVVCEVGDWSRKVTRGGNGRVSYSLLASRQPVTLLIVKFDGNERDRLTGSDLRKVAGSYFFVGTVPGKYAMTVEARDARGCSAGADRPMTVTVT